MGKSSRPRGTTRKDLCRCGSYYYKILTGGTTMKLSDDCQTCKPIKEENKKK